MRDALLAVKTMIRFRLREYREANERREQEYREIDR